MTRTGDRAADIAANTEKFNEILGRHIRSNPSLWLWCHRRWR
jgi:lauroyl/myristoyl acyltransferase